MYNQEASSETDHGSSEVQRPPLKEPARTQLSRSHEANLEMEEIRRRTHEQERAERAQEIPKCVSGYGNVGRPPSSRKESGDGVSMLGRIDVAGDASRAFYTEGRGRGDRGWCSCRVGGVLEFFDPQAKVLQFIWRP